MGRTVAWQTHFDPGDEFMFGLDGFLCTFSPAKWFRTSGPYAPSAVMKQKRARSRLALLATEAKRGFTVGQYLAKVRSETRMEVVGTQVG
jgi:hypothetical protein